MSFGIGPSRIYIYISTAKKENEKYESRTQQPGRRRLLRETEDRFGVGARA